MLQKATNQNKLLHSKVFTLFWERERWEISDGNKKKNKDAIKKAEQSVALMHSTL